MIDGEDGYDRLQQLFASPDRSGGSSASNFSVSPVQFDIAQFFGSQDQNDFEEVVYTRPSEVTFVLTPPGLIQVAVMQDSPELNFPWTGKRKRITGKTSKSMPELLCLLQQDPNGMILPSFTHKERLAGRNCFRKAYSSHTGESVRVSREKMSRVWSEASTNERNKWALLAIVHLQLYEQYLSNHGGLRGKVRVPLPDGTPFVSATTGNELEVNPLIAETYGVLLTFHSKFGLDDPLLIAWEKDLSSESVLQKLKAKPEYRAKFEEFKVFITDMMQVHRFKNCAVAMELCMNGQRKGRIHFHGFLGQECSYNGWMSHPVKATLRRNMLIFDNVFPNVQTMKCSGRRGMEMPTAHGLYSCMAPKTGQMFAWSTLVPFKDFISDME